MGITARPVSNSHRLSKVIIFILSCILFATRLWAVQPADAGLNRQIETGGIVESNATGTAVNPDKSPMYESGQLIIKYKDTVTESVRNIVKEGKSFRHATTDQSDSLDKLHLRYRVSGAKPVFRAEEEEDATRDKRHAALKRSYYAKLEKAKIRLAERTGIIIDDADIPDLSHIYVLNLPAETDLMKASEDFSRDPHVEYAYPNYIMKALFIPNDPYPSSTLAA